MDNDRVALTYVRYEAEGWGVGELVFADGRLVYSQLPRPDTRAPEGSHPLVPRLRAYFAGEPVDFADVEVELADQTPFGRRLAEAMRRIPYGEVVTYGELALSAGRPRAARAAGNFCARCDLAPILPVHRVVSANGIGGWGAYGTEVKRRLLELENASF
jgi:methylated-DNA-[protein]-cysteine S-methyltransferase